MLQALFVLALPLLLILVIFVTWKRKREAKHRCWNCDADLRGTARIDLRGDWRCPNCGDLIEADMPGRVDRL